MEVEYAFLADAADSPMPGGKLYLLGAGFDEISAPTFPAVHPYMVFVAKIKLHPSECGRRHSLEIELWDPDGQRLGPQVRGEVQMERSQAHPTRPAFVQVMFQMFGTVFPRPGTYEFHTIVNGQHMKTVALYVGQTPAENPAGSISHEDPPS